MSGKHVDFRGTERFEIKRQLGRGGMGVVYEALDRDRNELVALKCIRHFDARGLLRFKEEFRAVHDISHPNVVSLGELLEADGEWFFTMELVDGGTFLEFVRPGSQGPRQTDSRGATAVAPTAVAHGAARASLDDGAARGVGAGVGGCYDEANLRLALKQLALGLSALHASGKVHRDVKPSNVLVSTEGRLVILDFGLVKQLDKGAGSTQASVVGTAEYMAPEQAVAGQIAASADWYSVGVMMYEALTGRLPHTGRTALELMMAKQQRTPTPPRARIADVPGDLDELCMDLLRLEPVDRPDEAEILERLGCDVGAASPISCSMSSRGFTQTTPFVGREPELAALSEAFARSLGAAHIVVVRGASGLGKTQLVEQFARDMEDQYPDVVVLHSRCYERESVAYKAFDGIADSLSRYLVRLPKGEADALLPFRAGLLPRLFAVLQRVEAIAGAPKEIDLPDAHEQRRRMFGAFRELLIRLAKRHPVVLCIDDLQWTDADSLILLQELVADADSIPLLIVATMRPVADTDRAAVLTKVQAAAPTTVVELRAFSPEQAQELAALLMPGGDAALLATVAKDTGGHPLFIHELARHVAANTADTFEIAGSLDAALGARIERLPPDVRRLLEVVCVAGNPLTHEAAAAASELDRAVQAKASRVLRVAYLVRTDGVRNTDTIVAYHDRIRELVTQRLHAAETRHWHSRLAVALQQFGAEKSNPQALVHHAEAAGLVARAAAYAEAAAAYAVDAMAFDQAAQLFGVALRLGSYDADARRALQIARATALASAGRGPEAAEGLMAAADGADFATRLACQGQAAEQWIITGHIERGLEAIELLLADIGEPLAAGPRRALLSLLWHRFRIRIRGRRFATSAESEVAPQMLRRLDVLRTVAMGLATVDSIMGADFNARFLLLAQRVGEPRRLLQALGMEVGFLSLQAGSAGRRARLMFADVEDLAEGCDFDPYSGAWRSFIDGLLTYFEGRFRASAELFACAEAAFRRDTTGTTLERNNSRVIRLLALRWMGKFREAEILAADSIRDAEQRGDLFVGTTLRVLSAHPGIAGPAGVSPMDFPKEMWSPAEGGYHLQHWYELEAQGEAALFGGAAPQVLVGHASSFELLKKSLLLRMQMVRCGSRSLRARLLVAAAPHQPNQKAHLKHAKSLARKLLREGIDYASVLGLLIHAAIATQGPKRNDDQAIAYLRKAIDLADTTEMSYHAAAGNYRLGALLGGDEGRDAIARAEAWAAAEGVVDFARVVEVAAPGFSAM